MKWPCKPMDQEWGVLKPRQAISALGLDCFPSGIYRNPGGDGSEARLNAGCGCDSLSGLEERLTSRTATEKG